MGSETLGGDLDQDDSMDEAELEAALEAGFLDEEYKAPKEADLQKTPSDQSVDEVKSSDDNTDDTPQAKIEDEADPQPQPQTEDKVDEADPPADDEWAGVSDVIKKRFEKMASDLDRVTNIANSASGRANKLQSEIQRNLSKPADAPKPTSQQIHEAMVDKEKRDALREEWPDFAEAFDELDTTISGVVGSQIDNLREEIAQGQQQYIADQVKYNLDLRHPGWENTVSDDKFKDWVYEGGPNLDERTKYEQTLGYAQSLSNNSPAESEALFSQANDMYSNLLNKYPDWASNTGSLYGDPSGEAAIRLLDKHKQVQEQKSKSAQVPDSRVSEQARNRQRLADNIAPTSGSDKQVIVDAEEDLMSAFEAGFNS